MTDDLIRDDEDLGAPIAELANPTETPEAGFLRRIRDDIDRRILTGQIVDYSVWGFFKIFVEYLGFGVAALARDGQRRKERQ